MRVRWVIGGVVALVIVVGCSRDDGDIDEMANPLADLGLVFAALEGREAGAQLWLETDDAIKECMADEGFDYVAYGDDLEARSVRDQQARLTDEEFAAEHGFGPIMVFADPLNPPTDPNEEIYESLSDADRARYDEAMDGDGTGGVMGVFDGCRGAGGQVWGDPVALGQLRDAFERTREQFLADPAVVDAMGDFDGCLRSRGVESEGGSDGLVLMVAETHVAYFEEWPDGRPAGLPAGQEEERAWLQQLEIDAAVAAVECGMSMRSGLTPELARLRQPYLERFIDEHAELIAEVRATAG